MSVSGGRKQGKGKLLLTGMEGLSEWWGWYIDDFDVKYEKDKGLARISKSILSSVLVIQIFIALVYIHLVLGTISACDSPIMRMLFLLQSNKVPLPRSCSFLNANATSFTIPQDLPIVCIDHYNAENSPSAITAQSAQALGTLPLPSSSYTYLP